MATATENRIVVSVVFPKDLLAILEAEQKKHSTSFAGLMRRIIQWHADPKALGRHPDEAPVRLPFRKKTERVTKAFKIDRDDAAYLDKLGDRLAIPRVSVILLLCCDFFGVASLPRGAAN